MSSKKHILFLTPGFAENEEDTECIPPIQLLIEHLQLNEKTNCSIITFQYPYNVQQYSWKGVKVYSLGGNNASFFKKIGLWKKAQQLATQIHKENPVHQMHSFWFTECAYIGNKVSQQLNIPHSCTFMGQDVLKSNRYFSKIKVLPHPLITLSKQHTHTLFNEAQITSDLVIPWGIDPSQHPTSNQKNIDILGVGNLTELKNFSRFVEIIKHVQRAIPKIKVEIIGRDIQKNSLQALISQNNLTQNITLIKNQKRQQVLQKMSRSNILLHTSNYESFGMVLIEALACGAKVFSTSVGIAPEILEIDLIKENKETANNIITFLTKKESQKPKTPYSIHNTVDLYLKKVFLID